MRFLTFKRMVVPPPPDPNDGEVRLYADDAGALRTVQQDGTDAPVALAGSVSLDDLSDVDTTGGSEGDVLTQQNDGSFAPEPATGGSQPITAPTDIANCALWLDASDETTINAGTPSDDDPVSAWADKSDSGFDAAQASGDNQPTFKTGILNGLSAILCDHTAHDQYLALSGAALNLFRDLDAFTVAFVCTQMSLDNAGDNRNGILGASDGINTDNLRVGLELQANTTLNFCNEDGTGGNMVAPTIVMPLSPPSLLAPPLALVCALDLVQGIVVVDGMNHTANGDFSSVTALGPTPDTASVAIWVGALPDGNGGSLGYLCDIIVYTRALVASERSELLDYLRAKWALVY